MFVPAAPALDRANPGAPHPIPLTPLDSAFTQRLSVTPLDSALTKNASSNSFTICTYIKRGWGYPVMVNHRLRPALLDLCPYPSNGHSHSSVKAAPSCLLNLPLFSTVSLTEAQSPEATRRREPPSVTFLSSKKPSNSTHHPIAQRFHAHTVCGCILGFSAPFRTEGKGTSGG